MSGQPPAESRDRPVLITGGAGFIGCNLADRLAGQGHRVILYDGLLRPGVVRNVEWLQQRHGDRIALINADIRDRARITQAATSAGAVFHLAAQVAVTTSLVDPAEDFAINMEGTLLLLEALRRRNGDTPLVFASTNKVYGDLGDIALRRVGNAYLPTDAAIRARGIPESRPLDFHTPYGCSKGAADQYVLDYARSYGLPAVVLRMSCIYGPRQMGTEDQGWVAHFLMRAMAGETISIFGDGCQVRDVLFIDDAVDAYVQAWSRIRDVQGRVYNLGGGPENAISLLQLIEHIESLLDHPVTTEFFPPRAGDQLYYVSDTSRARSDLGLSAPKPWRQGVSQLANWLRATRQPVRHQQPIASRPAEAAL